MNIHFSELKHLKLFKKWLQYLVVPKKALTNWLSILIESTDNIAYAACSKVEKVI